MLAAIIGPLVFFAKTSLFLLYYRVFAPKKLFRYMITIGIVFSFFFCLTTLAIAVYLCAPHAGKDWDAEVLGSCSRHIALYYVISGAVNMALDIFMLILPIPVVLQLQLPLKKKVGVLAIFMTGLS